MSVRSRTQAIYCLGSSANRPRPAQRVFFTMGRCDPFDALRGAMNHLEISLAASVAVQETTPCQLQ